MIKQGRKKGTYRFVFKPINAPEQVNLAGDFSGWEPIRMRKQKDESYAVTVSLESGSYHYKYQVDGNWLLDQENQHRANNSYGTLNSVAVVE